MTHQLNITVEVPDAIDPKNNDPDVLAELVVDVYNEEVRHLMASYPYADKHEVKFVSAEWESDEPPKTYSDGQRDMAQSMLDMVSVNMHPDDMHGVIEFLTGETEG